MGHQILAAWKAAFARASKWQAPGDPTAVFEALGWSLVAGLDGVHAALPRKELAAVALLARGAIKEASRRAGTGASLDFHGGEFA